MTVSDASQRFRAAMLDACRAATAPLIDPDHDLLVRRGRPTAEQFRSCDEIIAVTRHSADLDFAAVGTNRQRELVMTLDIIVSVFRAGSEDSEDVDEVTVEADDRAYQLLDAIEEWVRVTDTTLGGVVRWCACTHHENDGAGTDPDIAARGREAAILATFTAPVRVTS